MSQSAMSSIVAVVLWAAPAMSSWAAGPTVMPRSADTDRRARVEALLPQIEKVYRDYAAEARLPGMVHGIVLDGELIHVATYGRAEIDPERAIARDTRFRIASMTKSFTAMAVLRLRDAGTLGLGDAVSRFVPEVMRLRPPTSDAPEVRIHDLLHHTAGFPTDDPWGDRQLDMPAADLKALLRRGLSFSNTTGHGFEYSNLGYALLGQVVEKAAGVSCQQYITREILRPLGMKNTVWDYPDVPAGKLARGYRWQDDAFVAEPILHDGTFGPMGGLITTIDDLARYTAFHLAAWPPRDDPDDGPVRRATVREMHFPHGTVRMVAESKAADGTTLPAAAFGYAYGLLSARTSQGVLIVYHSGGLPGYGSNYLFCPDLGVGLIVLTNRTYGVPLSANRRVLQMLVETAKLQSRVVPPSAILETRKHQVREVLPEWEETPGLGALFANNFFLDASRERRAAESRRLFEKLGEVRSVEPIVAENRLRGTFAIVGANGRLEVTLQLSPEAEPRVQDLRLRFLEKK